MTKARIMQSPTVTLIADDIRTPERLSRALRAERRSQGLTQAETARRAGVSPQWLCEFETGRAAGGTDRVMRVLDVLSLSIALHPRPVSLADRVLHEATRTP